jgi:polysaccharide chain length determinant protein (PEP-CTERM system associated)
VDDIQGLINKVWDEVRSSWRFRWWALAIGWVVCAIGWAVVMRMPNVYQANARVYLNTQSALRPLLQGLAVNPDVESDLALVRQALLSRPKLEKVARQTELDLHAVTSEQKERLISSLQKNITVQNDARVRNSNTDGLYRISFQYTSRKQALAVVQQLLDSFVEDTLGTKRTGQEDAQQFLRQQIADYEQRLSAAEESVSEFKKKNVGSMPSDRGDYFARMQAEMTELETARKLLGVANARLEELTRQLSGEEPFVFGFDAAATAGTSEAAGDLHSRIQGLERRQQDLLLRYTEKHPEVLAVQRTLDDLRAQQLAEVEKVKREKKVSAGMSSSFKANPVFESMEVERKKAAVQIAELREDVAQRTARVAELRREVNMVPEVEAQLARLNRDYEVTKSQYQQLLQRLETAQLSESADKTGTVNFQIIEPPMVQLEPVAPKRTIMLIAVLILGIGTSLAAAYGMNLLKPVYMSAESLEQGTGLTVLGSIMHAPADADVVRSRTAKLWLVCGAALLLVAFIAVYVVSTADGGRFLEQLFG